MSTIPVSLQSPAQIRAFRHDPRFIPSEIFQAESNGHKFSPGQSARLVGLEQFPELNGEVVKVSSIRDDGEYGRAYYITSEKVNETLNWVYEYRLEAVTP